MSRKKTLAAGGSAVLLCVALAWLSAGNSSQPDTELKADDRVDFIEVKIDVGETGDALDEPVVLDLGLGFPLWLHPVGRQATENVPFGAVPQETDAKTAIPAGSSATFRFTLAGKAGQDEFRTSSQLLAGVRVSDIARIGFASRGSSNWLLAGYAIKLNGKAFASASAEQLKRDRDELPGAKAALNASRKKLAELATRTSPLQTERDDLRALVKSKLATDADAQRLAEVEKELTPLLTQQSWLEGQLQGTYPWFEDRAFLPLGREKAVVQSVRVTTETCAHAGADTQNYVYFRTGGHKYLLASPAVPLTAGQGPQTFTLDLAAGALSAADLRGWAVGMLGQPGPYDRAPDRWHPRRVLVEVDGRVVYDSEDVGLDRKSLQAVRVIPPSHRDRDGKLVVNRPVSREVFVWEAGKGMGLDPDKGTVLPLPDRNDPNYPLPEPDGSTKDPSTDEVAPFFPGEEDPAWDENGWPNPPSGWPTPGWDPPPWGTPFQIESVRITAGWKTNHTFTVHWTVSGNESAIDHYHVSLLQIRPHQAMPFGTAIPLTFSAPPGARWVSGALPGPIADPYLFLAPVVVAIPVDPAATPHQRIGPARPIFPALASAAAQPKLTNVFRWVHPPPLIIHSGPVSFGGEPAWPGRAAWSFGLGESHNALLFDQAVPGWNIGVRPAAGDRLTVELQAPFFVGQHRFISHLGFLNGPDAANMVTARLQCSLHNPVTNALLFTYPVVTRNGTTADPMQILERVVKASDAGGPGPYKLRVRVTFEGSGFDPAHPPALFGVRLIPQP